MSGYEVFRKDSHAGAWILRTTTPGTQFTDSGLTAQKTYLYRVLSMDAAGNRSLDSNHEIATTSDFTDPMLSTAITVRARHVVEVRTAVNAMCTFAGTSLCPAPPFSSAELDEGQVSGQTIQAAHFTAVQNNIATLRAAIGASTATFQETPAPGILSKSFTWKICEEE